MRLCLRAATIISRCKNLSRVSAHPQPVCSPRCRIPRSCPAVVTWAPEDASNVPILSDVIAAAPTQPPATSTWGGFGSVVSGAITPDENEAEEEEESFLLDLESDYACYMTLTQDELANLSLVEGLLYLDASDEEDTTLIELGAMPERPH